MSSGAMRGILWDVVVLLLLTNVVRVKCQNDWDPVIENLLEKIMDPREPPTLQTQALRNDLIRRVKDALQREELENQLVEYKRSLSSLARWRNLPNKRNLEALARAGYIRTLPENDPDYKRSISSLAKNGQLPLSDNNDGLDKRGIESLARNGDLHHKRENQQSFYDDDDEYDKRNIASLARNYNFPSYGKRFIYELGSSMDKRNIAALAREGMKINGKRNVAALLRQDSYLNGARYGRDDTQTQKPEHYDDKRNIASIKAQYKPKFKRDIQSGNRPKRDADYFEIDSDEYPTPFYQNDADDYEDMLKGLAQEYEKPEKRFLGSVAKSGWFRPTSNRFVTPGKRHIGALARLGWLPSFRSIRRFNRSGRSTGSCDSRSFATDGEIENNAIAENPFELDRPRTLVPRVAARMFPRMYLSPKSF